MEAKVDLSMAAGLLPPQIPCFLQFVLQILSSLRSAIL